MGWRSGKEMVLIVNKQRRKEISNVIKDLVVIKKAVERIQGAEEDAYENMGDGLQSTMRGMNSEMAIDAIEDAVSHIDEAIDSLQGVL